MRRYVWLDKDNGVWVSDSVINLAWNVARYGPFKRYRLEEDPEPIEEPKTPGARVEFTYMNGRKVAHYIPDRNPEYPWTVFEKGNYTFGGYTWRNIVAGDPKILS